MNSKQNRRLVPASLCAAAGIALCGASVLASSKPGAGKPIHPIPATQEPVSYDRDIRPIIAENCFACHGFDSTKRQAGLRLDTSTGAFQKLPSGHAAVVPGNLKGSPLVHRISSFGSDKMPPASSGKRLKLAEIALITRWVAEGARYQDHWAFLAPKPLPLPSVKNPAWCRNPIDRYVLAKLDHEGLAPSPEADRRTLIRRVTLDLTGLPPSTAEVSAFLADRNPDAYDKVVDRLLASPHYGERMALHWLDLARYADTNGYHIDNERFMWRWRDWVIDAFNRDLPYDQFTIDQLAGDMLPSATLEQKVASGFNRNHPIDFEGGAIPEEYAAAYIFDRINTTSTVFLGLTLRCAQCHDHKYDPLTNRDFYRFYALFNNVPEQGLDGQSGNSAPYQKAPTPDQAAMLADYTHRADDLAGHAKARAELLAPQEAAWERTALASLSATPPAQVGLAAEYPLDETSGARVRDAIAKADGGEIVGKSSWSTGKVGGALSFDGSTHVQLATTFKPDRTDRFSYGAWINPTSNDSMTVVSKMDDADSFRGWDMFMQGGRVFVHLIHHWEDDAIRVNTKDPVPLNKWSHVLMTYDGSSKAAGVKVYVNGKSVALDVTHDKLSGTILTDKAVRIGRRTDGAPFRGMIDEVRLYNRDLSPGEVDSLVAYDSIRQDLMAAADKRSADQKAELAHYYLSRFDEAWRKMDSDAAMWRKKQTDLDAAIPTSMVMSEMSKPRTTHMLMRGQYDKIGEVETPGIPEVCQAWEPGFEVKNRLDLARWIVDPRNPLTARVAVNRLWMMLFGDGIVRTPENFGTQGEWPTNAKLLDWLACSFEAESGGRKAEGGGSAVTEAPRPPILGEAGPNGSRVAYKVEESSVTGDGKYSKCPAPAHGSPLNWGLGGHSTFNQRPKTTDQSPSFACQWSVKKLLRLIVTSATYRQSSRVAPRMEERDPENRLLARGPRFRLQAEIVRDQALAVGGLLVPKIGGPSVKPYQPAGLWEEMSFKGDFSAQYYVQDHGESLYRRSMYTFWKRTVPPPDLQTFDAPEREFCMVKRSVTNTPLQALVVMNDPAFVEASRKFAERILTCGEEAPAARLRFAFQTALCRDPKPEEARILLGLLARQSAVFRADPAAAAKLLTVGESKRDAKLDAVQLSAWTEIANTILNMDETLTKE